VVVGLLLSVPIIIPFAEFVSHSYVGLYSIGFSGLNKDALPILFFPWLYGSICISSDVFFIQSNVGGFLSATQFAVIHYWISRRQEIQPLHCFAALDSDLRCTNFRPAFGVYSG
jgi:hypothetical protein